MEAILYRNERPGKHFSSVRTPGLPCFNREKVELTCYPQSSWDLGGSVAYWIKHLLGTQETQALPLTCWVTLGKSFSLSVTQLSHWCPTGPLKSTEEKHCIGVRHYYHHHKCSQEPRMFLSYVHRDEIYMYDYQNH